MTRTVVVDGANVVGARPDGWWRDRAGAARRLHERIAKSDVAFDRVVLVLEGAAKPGVAQGNQDGVEIVHAPRSGDDEIVTQAVKAVSEGADVTVVTADRGLETRVRDAGADVLSPSRFLAGLA